MILDPLVGLCRVILRGFPCQCHPTRAQMVPSHSTTCTTAQPPSPKTHLEALALVQLWKKSLGLKKKHPASSVFWGAKLKMALPYLVLPDKSGCQRQNRGCVVIHDPVFNGLNFIEFSFGKGESGPSTRQQHCDSRGLSAAPPKYPGSVLEWR